MAKASKGINLSEDIFAGFNFVLRGGESTQGDYIQVGKGRDVGLDQISKFTQKVSLGNGQQFISRDVYRLASTFDICRLLSFYYSSVGYYLNQASLIVALFTFTYARIFSAFILTSQNVKYFPEEITTAITAEFTYQIGFLLIFPIIIDLCLERRIGAASEQ